MRNREFQKGSIIMVDFGEITEEKTNLQKGKRPAVVLWTIRNSNKYTVAPLTSKFKNVDADNHIVIKSDTETKLNKNSMLLMEDVTTITAEQVGFRIGFVGGKILSKINNAIAKMMGIV